MELHGENSFKLKSYQSAAFRIDKMTEPLAGKSVEELAATDGIGQSLSKKIYQLTTNGTFPELEVLYQKTPSGVLEMMEIKGIGPKKVSLLWKELGLESIGELLYACNENRLLALKGFGAKTQEQIIKSIEFKNSTKGQFLFSVAEDAAILLEETIKSNHPHRYSVAGELRRKCEIITSLDFIIAPIGHAEILLKVLSEIDVNVQLTKEPETKINGYTKEGIPFQLVFCDEQNFTQALWRNTSTVTHIALLEQKNPELSSLLSSVQSEEEIYTKSGLHYQIPEQREAEHQLLPSTENEKHFISIKELKGVLHNHSTWSDGLHTLEEMAVACKELGFQYFGICDHSRTAVYAGGLSIENVLGQHKEIDKLNEQLQPFKILKGIESDILSDGSLDYPDEILSQFDFIVASIHSGFKMDEAKATDRLIKAISNPYTTILGHPTGRLLLSRPGYPVNHKALLDACAEFGVVIELNAHPYRLDIDWRWLQYALEKNVMVSINPDAHSIEGFHVLKNGVNAARKGGLTVDMTFNALNLNDIEEHFRHRKAHLNAGYSN